ncbi:MAG: carboxymuconolactone decarboxylase family protein [Dehalococcoidia bacterium]
MSQQIELRALVNREGRLLLFRSPAGGEWTLPGGSFAEESDDVDAAMDTLLRQLGIVTVEIAEAFLQTTYVPRGESHDVLNLYAPMDWTGEPAHPEGHEAGWFHLDDLIDVPMDGGTRDAVLRVYGVLEPGDDGLQLLAALNRDAGTPPATAGAREPDPEHPGRHEAGLDVLRTLGGAADPTLGFARMKKSSPELADDIVDFALGEVWSHPGLDRRTRSLEVVAMLAALGGRAGPLRSHINGALNHGATPDQVVQTLRMVAVYAGFPAALEAWPIMEEVFAARGVPRPGAAL